MAKGSTLFQGALAQSYAALECRTTMEVEDANRPWTASKTWRATWSKVRRSRLSPEDGKIRKASITELARDGGGYNRFVVIDTRRATEVADAARFAEQAKKERSQRRSFEEEMGRTEPRTWQVSADKLTDVSEATAQVVRYGLGRQTGFVQQKHIEEINGFNRLKWLDEETLRAMVRAVVKNGSPADDKIRFVFHLASDETSCRTCGRRAF